MHAHLLQEGTMARLSVVSVSLTMLCLACHSFIPQMNDPMIPVRTTVVIRVTTTGMTAGVVDVTPAMITVVSHETTTAIATGTMTGGKVPYGLQQRPRHVLKTVDDSQGLRPRQVLRRQAQVLSVRIIENIGIYIFAALASLHAIHAVFLFTCEYYCS